MGGGGALTDRCALAVYTFKKNNGEKPASTPCSYRPGAIREVQYFYFFFFGGGGGAENTHIHTKTHAHIMYYLSIITIYFNTHIEFRIRYSCKLYQFILRNSIYHDTAGCVCICMYVCMYVCMYDN